MSDNFTESTTQSWMSRLGGAFKGIIFGIIMFVLSFPLLWWNEGRTIERHQALEEGAGLVVSVNSNAIDPGNAGKLIHTSGTATSNETLTDPDFGISAEALQLRRDVQMFQWQEQAKSSSEKNLGGSETTTTTYQYSKDWSSSPISSSGFHHPEGHQNPAAMPFESNIQTAANAHLGAFRMTPEQIAKLSNFQPVSISGKDFSQIKRGRRHITGNTLYIGYNPSNPQIGDIKIDFSQMPATPVSIVAQQQNDGFSAYLPKAGGSILLIEQGNKSAEAMFKGAEEANTMMAWLIRLGGLVLMFIGIQTILRPLSVIGDVVPFIGSIIAFGTGTLSFLLALPLALLTIAIAWIFYRPLLAGALILAAIASFVVPYMMKRKNASASTPISPSGGTVQE